MLRDTVMLTGSELRTLTLRVLVRMEHWRSTIEAGLAASESLSVPKCQWLASQVACSRSKALPVF